MAEIFKNSAAIATPNAQATPVAAPKVDKPVSAVAKDKPKPAAKPVSLPPLGLSVRVTPKPAAAPKPVVEEKKAPVVIEAPVVKTPQAVYGSQPVDVEKLRSVWMDFSNNQTSFLQQTLRSAIPDLKNDTIISITLDNSFQEEKVNSIRQQLLPYLRKTLNNNKLTLDVILTTGTQVSKAYTPKEKLMLMIKENPALGQLIETLALEMD